MLRIIPETFHFDFKKPGKRVHIITENKSQAPYLGGLFLLDRNKKTGRTVICGTSRQTHVFP